MVIVMNPNEPANHHQLDGIALTGLHLKFDAIIYVAPGKLSLLQCVQVKKQQEIEVIVRRIERTT
jgi:hypothetical protein